MTSFEQELETRGLRVQRILVSSARKQQVTALVADGSEHAFVAKWRASGSADDSGSLHAELRVYRDNPDARYLPRAHVLEQELLIVEHVPSCTLRQFLLDHVSSAPTDVRLALTRFFAFFQDAWGFERFYFSRSTHDALLPFMRKLCLSGPRDTARHRHHLANAALVGAALAWMRARADRLQFDPPEPLLIHGDLHLDNVLVSDSSRELKVIDWENSRRESPLLDFLYSTAMLHCILNPHPELRHALADAMNEAVARMRPNAASATRHFHALFCQLIATNNRFGGASAHSDWLRAWARVPARLLAP